MKIVKRDVYISEFSKMTFFQRWFYVVANNYRVDWERFKPNINPLKWCLLDLIKIAYLPVLIFAIFPILLLFASPLEAAHLKRVYSAKKDEGWYKSNCLILE